MLSEGKEDEDELSMNPNDKRTNVASVVDTVVDDGESDDSDPLEEQLFSEKSSDINNLEPNSKSVSSTSSKSSASSISAMHFLHLRTLVYFWPRWTTVTLGGYYWIWTGYGVTHFVIEDW